MKQNNNCILFCHFIFYLGSETHVKQLETEYREGHFTPDFLRGIYNFADSIVQLSR